LTINEGVAVDARLVQSASHPLSTEEIKKQREKRDIPEGKLDKNGNLLKFSRDLESDWTIKNDKPHYGLKEHASVDGDHGFVLSTDLTPASVSDSIYLPHCIAASCHTEDPIRKVYADKGYYGKPNRGFLYMNGIADGIMRKDTRSTKLTDYEKERNKGISKKSHIVEQYFGLSHLHSRTFRARSTRIVKTSWMLFSGRWSSICSEGVESSERCKYSQRTARTQSNGQISHETAPVTERFEVNRVAITGKLINIRR
jgi:transposase, IS5 family